MPAAYTKITETEMDEFLFGQGFKAIKRAGTNEKVYGKRVDVFGLQLTLRVLSSIEYGEARKAGKDGIYCELIWRQVVQSDEGDQVVEHVLCRSNYTQRIQTWKKNLLKRIDHWQDEMLGPPCSRCTFPMVEKENKRDKTTFWGCSQYRNGTCNSTTPKRKL